MFGKNWLPRILLGIHFITKISQCAVFISLWNWFFFWGEARQEAPSVFGTQLSTGDAHRRGGGTPPCSPHQQLCREPARETAQPGDSTAVLWVPSQSPVLLWWPTLPGTSENLPLSSVAPRTFALWPGVLLWASPSSGKVQAPSFLFWGSSYNEKEWRNSKPGL